MSSTPAALYMRSSKDRSEVALPVQRKELHAFASAHDLRVVREFEDMTISGSLDETSRPGLGALLAEMASLERKWDVLLATDTSRLARDPMLALYIQHEADKYGVEVRYSKMDISGKDAFGEMFLAQLRAFDRLHARMSAEKGRQGLMMNIANGHRAGGRSPTGYTLEHTATGTMRDGKPVTKSKLILDPRPAKKVQIYLRARAQAVPRFQAAKTARLTDKSQGSLIAIERNALCYAGFTVWNMRRKHAPTRDDPRKTMLWNPRDQWVISKTKTHEALISTEEAEVILAAVDATNPRPTRMSPRKPDAYLLTGLLYTPDGNPFQADGQYYRLPRKGARIAREPVEVSVMQQVRSEIAGKELAGKLVQAARDMANEIDTSPEPIRQEQRRLQNKIDGLVSVIAETHNALLVQKLEELQGELARLREEEAASADRARMKTGLRALTVEGVRAMLEFAAAPVGGKLEFDVASMRRTLGALVRRIELDPATRQARLFYSIGLEGGAKVASPGGFEPPLPP